MYTIEKLTLEEKTKHPEDEFKVIEQGFKPLVLDTCPTMEEAEKSKKVWETRDELEDDISDFISDMEDKYHGRLSDKEIRQMIIEH